MAASTTMIRIAAIAGATWAMAACDAFEHLPPDHSSVDGASVNDALADGAFVDGAFSDGFVIDAPAADSPWGDGSGPPRCLMTSSMAVREGTVGSFSIALAWPPPGPSAAVLTLADTTVASIAPTALSFTTSNWSTPQAVSVEAFQDADAFDESLAFSCSTGNTTEHFSILILDDEAVTIIIEPAHINLTEGASGAFGLWLSAQPSSTVVLTVTPNDPSAVAASPASFVFTSSNWTMPQILNVVALQDADAFDENTAVTIGGSGVPGRAASVSINDDD